MTRLVFLAGCCFLEWSGLELRAQSPGVFQSVDLSTHFNLSHAPTAAAIFPQGQQTLGGIPFVLGGRIQVTGLDAAHNGEFHPAQVTGVPVGQKAARLHLLHGALHGAKEGVPLANLNLHFKNGESHALRLSFGVHARNVVVTEAEGTAALADGNSTLVWPVGAAVQNDSGARLYHTVLENPLPDAEIATLDFVSLFGRATPVLFAVTLQASGELAPLAAPVRRKVWQRASEFPDTAYRRSLKVRVVEAGAARPVTNAVVLVTVQDDTKAFFFGEHRTDRAGELVVDYPPQAAVSLGLRVNSPGFVVGSRNFSSSEAGAWPESIELPLERGQIIGGRVVDPGGQPIAGVTVTPYEIVRVSSNTVARADVEAGLTGADGRWQTTADRRSLSNLVFEVAHPEYRLVQLSQLNPAELTARTILTTLQPEMRVAGRVVNEAGQALAKATVILDYGATQHVVRYTDEKGHYSFIVRNATNSTAKALAFAKSLAPVMTSAALDTTQPRPDIVLKSGSTYRLKMADARGRPVAGVDVKLTDWQGSRGMSWATKTDSEGRFRWDHAPEGRLTFEYSKTGYSRYTHTVTLPMPNELNYTYSQPTRVAGRVIDAVSKKAVDQIRVSVRYSYKNGSGSTSTTGRNGTFSSILGSTAYEEITLLLEAKGYEPLSEKLPPFEGSYSNVFELRRAQLIPVAVSAPDGSPAAGAEVILLGRTASGYMDAPGKFRSSATVYEISTTDAQGRAELTPKLEADLVLATHPQSGYAEVPLTQVTNTGRIALKPWGQIKGVLRVGDKVEPFHSIALRTIFINRDPGTPRTLAPLYVYRDVKPNADGSFVLDSVPPGTRSVSLHYKFADQNIGNTKLSHTVVVAVEPGRTNDVIIGGTGRTVLGQVDLTGISPGSVDWRRDAHKLVRQPSSRIPPPMRFPPNATAQERVRLLAERNAQLQAMNQAQVRENLIERTYVLLFEDDGSFRIPNVPPGAYHLNIHPTDARTPNSSRQIGTSNQEVIVGAGPGPLDVGKVQLRWNQ